MNELLNQECKIFTAGNPDKFGKITWGIYQTVPCRFVKTSKHYKNAQGNDVNISCKFQVSSESNFADIGSKVEYNSKAYIIIDYKEWVGGDGEILGWLYYCDNYPN